MAGLLDEPAHLLTAWLFLAAVPATRGRLDPRWLLLGAVVLDVDHLPLYLWGALATSVGGRPATHSLVTVLALLTVAGLSRRLRATVAGLAAGVLLHFFRDVATGPGLPIAWPLSGDSTVLPYGLYLGVSAGLAMVAVARLSRAPRGPRPVARDQHADRPAHSTAEGARRDRIR